MKVCRRYIALLLAAALLLTGHSAAANSIDRDATGQVILCTGSGPVTVYVDEDGTPVGAPHICPDCITHLLDFAQNAQAVLAPVAIAKQIYLVPSRAQCTVASKREVRARAPPLV